MPELMCDCCRKPYVVWFTNNDLWNKYAHYGNFTFLCPTCFIVLAERNGCKTTGWFLTVEERAPYIRESLIASTNSRVMQLPGVNVVETFIINQHDGASIEQRAKIASIVRETYEYLAGQLA